jgi:hypothetical protein
MNNVAAVERLARCRHPLEHVVDLPLRGDVTGKPFVRYQCVRCGSCRVAMGDNPGRWDRPLLVKDVIEASRPKKRRS